MPHWDRVTPALYGIAKKIARPVIKSRWDALIVPTLQEEEKIYVCAFHAFAFTRSMNDNSAFGLEIFRTILRHDGIEFEHEPIPSAIFDAYWDLAEDNDYWQPGHYAEVGQQLSYDHAIQEWESHHQDRIRWCEERLRQWLNEN